MKKYLIALFTMSLSQCFANACDPCPPTDCAYNIPYCIDLPCRWNFFVTGGFIWWEAKEENLSLGSVISLNSDVGTTSSGEVDPILFPSFKRVLTDFKFQYQPGFQVGLGYNLGCDNWEIFGEYTYFRSESSSSLGPLVLDPNHVPLVAASPQILPNWYSWVDIVNFLGIPAFNKASGTWSFDLDIGDIQLARKYYVGKCLIFRTYSSLRAAWLRQKYEVSYDFPTFGGEAVVNMQYNKTSKTDCWSIGPRVGLDTSWLFCSGFRLFTNSGASLLFTKYSDISQSAHLIVDSSGTDLSITPIDTAAYSNQPCYIRPQADILLGAGWGTNFCQRYYFDLEVGYMFSIFWNQNMFLDSEPLPAGPGDFPGEGASYYPLSTPSKIKGGDLTLSGLVIKARIDF